MTRKLIFLSMFATTVGSCLVVAVLQHTRLAEKIARSNLIDYDHWKQISHGMRQNEVEAILGGPPGIYRTEPVEYGGTFACIPGVDRNERWEGNQGMIKVDFDIQGRVVFKSYFKSEPLPPPSSFSDLYYLFLRWIN
jgi:hypothetical protein